MYFVMTCHDPMDQDGAMLHYEPDEPLRMWAEGIKFSTDLDDEPEDCEPPLPVEVEVEKGSEGAMLEFFIAPLPLMTKRLTKALKDGGVTNVDEYEAVITETSSGKQYNNYVAVNIVGVVAAADLAKSKLDQSIPWFDKLEIDPTATRGALLFRLKESTNAIIAHESVKKAIEKAGIDTLIFIEPSDWAG